jgi:vancomycin permeability regulator SanA
VAAAALQHGDVQKLILSGDNRFENYDEPTAMKHYLVDTYHIDPAKLQSDFAGRSTYESCDRAQRVFGQHRLVLISAESHLPRAIYLCRHLGVEAYGLASHLEADNATRREALARVKAVYNIYVHGEPTIYGAKVSL